MTRRPRGRGGTGGRVGGTPRIRGKGDGTKEIKKKKSTRQCCERGDRGKKKKKDGKTHHKSG